MIASMAEVSSSAIPSPNFTVHPAESALSQKTNLWTEVLNERAQLYGIRKHKYRDYDLPKDEMKSQFYNTKHSRKEEKFGYNCDACDRGFHNQDQYDLHTSEHEKCRVKDCNYVAAAKLVKLHYNMQHATGLADKIKESSEDMQKWIEERRRNFPTAANIRRKQEELREKQERGEVLETKQFGKMGRGGRGRGRNRGGYSRAPYTHHSVTPTQTAAVSREQDSNDPLSTLASTNHPHSRSTFTHVASHVAAVNNTQPSSNHPPNSTSSPALGALGSLFSSYGDVSSEEEGEISKPAQPAVTNVTSSSTTQPSDDRPTADLRPSHTSESLGPSNHQSKRHRNKNKMSSSIKSQQQQQDRNISKSKSSLLEKLLANEIRHERNVLLQCVKYVVDQDFFGVGKTKPPPPTTSYDDDDEW